MGACPPNFPKIGDFEPQIVFSGRTFSDSLKFGGQLPPSPMPQVH